MGTQSSDIEIGITNLNPMRIIIKIINGDEDKESKILSKSDPLSFLIQSYTFFFYLLFIISLQYFVLIGI